MAAPRLAARTYDRSWLVLLAGAIVTFALGLVVLGFAAGLYCIRHLSVTVALLAFIVGLFWAVHGAVDLISLSAGLFVMFKPTIWLTVLLAVLGGG